MFPDEGAGEIRAHVAKLRHDDEPEHVKMSRDMSERMGDEIDDLRDERKQPRHVKHTEERVGHGLERQQIARHLKHLPREDDEHEEDKRRDFEVITLRRPDATKIEETPTHEHGAAEHPDVFEVRQLLVLEHHVILPQADQGHCGDQEKKADLESREDDP